MFCRSHGLASLATSGKACLEGGGVVDVVHCSPDSAKYGGVSGKAIIHGNIGWRNVVDGHHCLNASNFGTSFAKFDYH